MDERGADAARPQLSHAAGPQARHRNRGAAQVQDRRRLGRARRRHAPPTQRDRRLRAGARPPDHVRALPAVPRRWRLHPRRPDHERHGRRRDDPLRTPPLPQHHVAAGRRRQGGARPAQGPDAVRPVAHGPLRRRQVHDREPAGDGAAPARIPHLPARRRQRSPRPQQRPWLYGHRPRGEHPACLGGRPADARRGADRHRFVHLAVPQRAVAWRGS